MPATPISSHLPGLAPSMNPREPAHHARDAGFSPTPTSKSPGSHYPQTPASPQKRPPTHTNQQIPGLAPLQSPREPAKMASHPHQPASHRARTTPKPPRAREDGLSRTPTSRFPGSHHSKAPASPQKRPPTHPNQQVTGLAPPQSPREPAKTASDRRQSVNE